jgi:hypothetical protein
MSLLPRARAASVAGAVVSLSALASAQSFQNVTNQMPANGGYTENVDFADVDGDGDRDAMLAEGGDSGNDQNDLWINRGFEPGGTIGFFADRTATQLPAVLDDSRDVDFVDIDRDGDFDVYVSNTSTIAQQTNRWLVNMGGLQGGTQGFFQEQTATRWTFLGVNDGVSHFSSLAPSSVLVGGGFIDWSCDCVFGDLDNDGDPDIFHSTYGGNFFGTVPSRIFLNSGTGTYEEFNPSHFQLFGTQINNGNPGLWAQGTHQTGTLNTNGTSCDIADTPLGIEIGDLDGDLDVDLHQGARNETPRTYKNYLAESGSFVAFRDVTGISGYLGSVDNSGNYEQELGDFENDDDLDLYGLNWPGIEDVVLKNNGSGVFGGAQILPGSGADDNEGDFFDYDNDGRLDLYVTNFSGQDKLYHNGGPPSFTFTDVTATVLPTLIATGLGGDSCDFDHDGDYDFLVGNDGGQPEFLLKNLTQIPDATAPRLARLEQAPDRNPSATPTAIRVQLYDNASWDVARYDTVVLEHNVNGGSWTPTPMRFAGGQMFRGEIPGTLVGTITYRVSAADEHNNTALSLSKSYVSSGACLSQPVQYCTAGTSSNGCSAILTSTGTASATASSGFVLTANTVPGQRSGLFFYGISGRLAAGWAPGSTSLLCVKPPVQRTIVSNSGGTLGSCDGQISMDWNAFMYANPFALGQPLQVGQVIDAQAWYRDPPAPGTTNLADGIEFAVCP